MPIDRSSKRLEIRAPNWLEIPAPLTGDWRDVAFSQYDYATQPARGALGQEPRACKITMACEKRWKLIFFEGYRPMLFDLENDPDELSDLGNDPEYARTRQSLTEAIFAWARRERQQVTVTDDQVFARTEEAGVDQGCLIGFWDELELKQFRGGSHPLLQPKPSTPQ